MKTRDQFHKVPAPDAILEGHDYLPDWISVPFFVDRISGGIVYGEFYTGHRRHFTIKSFKSGFSHHKSCITCSSNNKEKKNEN